MVRPAAHTAQSDWLQGPPWFHALLSSHFPEYWETFGAHMDQTETELADSQLWLRPHNPVISHLDPVISTRLGFGPGLTVGTGCTDQPAWRLNRCKKDCDSLQMSC